jgi:hypothetical protein
MKAEEVLAVTLMLTGLAWAVLLALYLVVLP